MKAKPSVAVIDSGGANIASVLFALEHIGVKGKLTSDVYEIKNAERVILPGVGSAGAAMVQLQKLDLTSCIQSLTQPVLGICLGMQLLFSHSAEGNTNLLGVIEGAVSKFDNHQCAIVPHMGWNTVDFNQDHPLTRGLASQSYFYFVHSFRADTGDYTIGETNYGSFFSAIVAQGNFMGCQFHPERSGLIGSQLLRNFVEM